MVSRFVCIVRFALVLAGVEAALAPELQAFPQANTSVVDGVVKDPTGAVVPGCVVTLTSIDTGGRLTTLTNQGSVFAFPSVSAGSYGFQAVKEGFQSYEIQSLRVAVGSHSTIDVALTIGVNAVTVIISANGSSLLEPSSNELGTLIEPVSVQQLPLNGRNYLQLGYLSGAAQDGGTATSNFLSVQTGHSDRDISIAGTEQDMVGFTIDGISVAGSRLGDASLNVSIAAIDQFKVVQGFFLPSAGTDPGTVNVVTKSEANSLTGPGINNWDVGLEKNFRMRESRRIQFRAELFNAWNHAQFENPDNTVGNVTFGRVTQARRAREIQFGLKLLW